jgi:hypothetical protein
MQADDIRVGRTFLDGSGAERCVWAIICGKVYFYTRSTNDAPWLFERHAEAPSVEAFAQLIPEEYWPPTKAARTH